MLPANNLLYVSSRPTMSENQVKVKFVFRGIYAILAYMYSL